MGIPRQPGGTQQSMPGTGGVAPGPGANPGAPSYLGSVQQAAMMKQMQMEQEKRTQLHLLEQQKRQILREQRQQQQLLVEQVTLGVLDEASGEMPARSSYIYL